MLYSHALEQFSEHFPGVLGPIIGNNDPRTTKTHQNIFVERLTNGFGGRFTDCPAMDPFGKTVMAQPDLCSRFPTGYSFGMVASSLVVFAAPL